MNELHIRLTARRVWRRIRWRTRLRQVRHRTRLRCHRVPGRGRGTSFHLRRCFSNTRRKP